MLLQLNRSRQLAVALLFGLAACGTQNGVGPGSNALAISPDTLSVEPQQSYQFSALSYQQGVATPVGSVIWATTGGSITSQGLFTADTSIRDYMITAQDGSGHLATASVHSLRKIQQLILVPGTASVVAGGTVQFHTYGITRSGDSVAASATFKATGGTVNSTGLYSAGTSLGTFQVVANNGSLADTSAVTITAVAPPPAECATPQAGWIWCDDFEQDRLSSYFEYDAAGGNFVRAAGVGFGGSTGMKAHWNAGQTGAGSLHLAMGAEPSSYFRTVDAGTANYREVYWRMYLKNQAGWTGGGGDKVSRAIVFANSNWAEAAISHVWSGTGSYSNYLVLDPVSGTDASGNLVTTTYDDFAHFTWLGQGHGVTPIFDASHVGQWYCVEAHMKLNTPGNSDGVFELWINGSPETQRTGLNYLGSFSNYGINAVFVENFWNAGSPVSQERYIDNFVVSTSRVGCLS